MERICTAGKKLNGWQIFKAFNINFSIIHINCICYILKCFNVRYKQAADISERRTSLNFTATIYNYSTTTLGNNNN